MKKTCDAPTVEHLVVFTESVMTDSSEIVVDNEENDNVTSIFTLLNGN